MDGINLNRNIISLIILFCIVFHSTIVVAAEDPDPLPGQVLFGAIEYAFGETMKIIFQGILDSNDEIWLFYNPTGYKVKIFDPDRNLYFGNEVVYYTPQSSGNWHAQFVVDTNYLPWEENWVPIFDSYTYVRPALTTDLQQTGSTLNSISLSWSYPADPGVDKYDVEVKQSGQNTGTQYAINDYQKATINNLKSGTLYDIRVRPVDVSGNVGDWTDYVTMSTENILPIAAIDYITPSNSYEGNKVSFKGTGNDPDGTIESYKWWSDKDEVLSYSNTFSTTSLSPGSHTIFFKVKDNTNAWSDVVSRSITVNEITPSPSVSISSSKEYPDKDESYKVKVMIENNGGSASGKLYLYENNVLLQVQDISVPKGSQISRTFTRSQSSPEKYEYKAEVVLSNGAGSRSSVKTAYVYVYSGTESINLDKDEYYYNHDTKCSKVALARALNIHPDLPYNVKWYNDVTLKYDLILTGDESKRSIPGKVGDKIKVELTKPNGNVIDSDNAIIVVEPLNLKIGVILAKPIDEEPDSKYDIKNYEDILKRMTDYYQENSYGRIIISSFDIFDNNGNWYQVPNYDLYYGQNRSADGNDYTFRFRDDAVSAASISPNEYDIIAVVHPGDSEQVSGNYDDMKTAAHLDSFVISENETMGIWAHEAGHVIGRFGKNANSAPDRYENGNLDSWDLMSHGCFITDQDGNAGGISFPSHMSSWTKEFMGWLEYDITYKTGTYWVPALEQMQYGDDVMVYDVPKQPGMNKYSYILEVRSENVGMWDRYLYDDKTEYYDMLVIYQVNTTSIGSRSDIVNIFDKKDIFFANDMVLLTLNEEYQDSNAEILMKLDTIIGEMQNGYGGNVAIKEFKISNQNGAGLSTTGNPSSINFISPAKDMNLTLPDYDLHAFTQDGRHVGVNYTSGDYENQIDGATASGDMLGGVEWIFVPEYEDIKFTVSNHDTEEFLKQYPGPANITADMKYNLTIYHEDSRSIRYNAGVTEQQIVSGKERNYLFNIVENMDGTFTIILDHEPPIISRMNPANNSIVGKGFNISAYYEDEGTGVDINSIKLKVDGIDVTSDAIITESFLLYTPLLEDGQHTFEMMVADNMENAATLNYSFTVDTTPPEVDIIYPANISFVHETVEIEGIATDLHLDTMSLEINDIEVSDNPGFTWDTTIYTDGIYTIRLTASDVVGNSASTSSNVTVDNTPPNVLLDLINGTEFYSDESWTVNFTASDSLSGIDTAVLTIDKNEWNRSDIVDMRYLSLGEHEVVVLAYDNAGNHNSTSANFTIKPLPAIVDVSPKTLNINSNGNWITGFIEVPGYSPELIDVSTVILNDTIHAVNHPTGIGDNNGNGASDLMVKFNRSEVQNLIHSGNITLIIVGKVDYAAFSGYTQITVIDNHQNKDTNGNKGTGGGKS